MVEKFKKYLRNNNLSENTISSYLFSEYSHYITNGQVICQDTEIPQELITKLKDNFEKAIYSLPEFIDLLKSLNIDNYSNLLTNVNLLLTFL